MFIIELTYIQPISEVEKYLTEHVEFLDKGFAAGYFLASGRKVPRTGGIIFCKAPDKDFALNLIEGDPFYQHQLANYTIVEIQLSKFAEGLEQYLS
jgi:uncharacterized protein YciI